MTNVNPLKVLYIHQDGNVTGSAISLSNLLSALDRKHYEPRVLLGAESTHARDEMQAAFLFKNMEIPVDHIPLNGFWTAPGPDWTEGDFYRNFKAFLPEPRLDRYLRQHKPDVIHINDKAMLTAGLTASRQGFPLVWHLRSTYKTARSPLQAKISCWVIKRLADQLIAISEDESDGFENTPNLHIIHNSVDFCKASAAEQSREKLRDELGLASGEILVGTVSTFIGTVRGTWDFIQAAGLAAKKMGDRKIKFVIVAGIPEKAASQTASASEHPLDQVWRMARENGIEDRLALTGFRTDALALMAAMDIVVVCNRHGVLGRMPLEAMTVGCPVVATAGHSGRSQVVIDGKTAFIVPPIDPGALAEAIVRLSSNQELRVRMGESGRAHAKMHFNPQTNARAVEKVYQLALQNYHQKKGLHL